MTKEVLKTINLSKTFTNKCVLKKINLSMFEGRNLTIIGKSGEGKSVLLKCILGLIEPSGGEVFYNNSLVTTKNKGMLFQDLGVLFQGSALFDSLTVWENISFQYKYRKAFSHKDCKKIAIHKLNLVGLNPSVAEQYPAELSGGMQKRVAIARAIATNPKILFFDEPTSGLDPVMANVINKLIRKIVSQLGATAITISHDLTSIRMIADDIALLNEGEIIWKGPKESLETTENLKIKEFIQPK